MNIGEVLWQIQKRAAAIAWDIWNGDYSFMAAQFLFGVSMVDIIAVILALLIVYELIKRAMNVIGEFLTFLSRRVLEFLYQFLLNLFRRIVYRALYTLRYFWNLPVVASWVSTLSIHAENLFYRLRQPKRLKS